MLETPPTPLWLELLKAVIGPVIAAIFVIIGLIVRDRIERRNAAREWFEKTYITEGLDVVLTQLSVLAHATIQNRRLILGTKISPMDSSVATRLFAFMPNADFLSGIDTVQALLIAVCRSEHPITLSTEESKEVLSFCLGLATYGDALRRYLLNTQIKTKTDVYKINKDARFLGFVRGMDDDFLPGMVPGIDLKTMNNRMAEKFGGRIVQAAKTTKNVEKEELD